MTSTTTSRRAVSEPLLEDLRAAILLGSYAPGDALPSERRLSEQYAVARHAVREARGRLEQAGLVEVSHGGATRVRDWRASGGLDLLAQLPLEGVLAGGELLRSVLEMRRSIGVDVARLAAARAPEQQLAELELRAAARPSDGLEAFSVRYEELWRALVRAAGNVAYVLAYNSLLAVSQSAREVFEAEARDLGAHERLVAAVVAGEPERAAAQADALLGAALDRPRASGASR